MREGRLSTLPNFHKAKPDSHLSDKPAGCSERPLTVVPQHTTPHREVDLPQTTQGASPSSNSAREYNGSYPNYPFFFSFFTEGPKHPSLPSPPFTYLTPQYQERNRVSPLPSSPSSLQPSLCQYQTHTSQPPVPKKYPS